MTVVLTAHSTEYNYRILYGHMLLFTLRSSWSPNGSRYVDCDVTMTLSKARPTRSWEYNLVVLFHHLIGCSGLLVKHAWSMYSTDNIGYVSSVKNSKRMRPLKKGTGSGDCSGQCPEHIVFARFCYIFY